LPKARPPPKTGISSFSFVKLGLFQDYKKLVPCRLPQRYAGENVQPGKHGKTNVKPMMMMTGQIK